FKFWYAYGNYVDEVVMMGSLIAPPFAKFCVHDHLNSPAALTNWTGTVLERYEYDAYGSPYVLEPNFADDPDGKTDYSNPYYFTGRRLDLLDDGNLTLQINRHRYYDYYTGRWLTHDPKGYVDGMNFYQYARSNPVILTDPWGTCPCAMPFWFRFMMEHATDFIHVDLEPGPGDYCWSLWTEMSKKVRYFNNCPDDLEDFEGRPCVGPPFTKRAPLCKVTIRMRSFNYFGSCKRDHFWTEHGHVRGRTYRCNSGRWEVWLESPVPITTMKIRETTYREKRYLRPVRGRIVS
ncbi:MAG: RHS repeat domain-containing protein, partial [Planctomycetota bacterium]